MGLITNFYDFFNSSYFCAIYADTFVDVQEEMTKILKRLTVIAQINIFIILCYFFFEILDGTWPIFDRRYH